MKEWEIAATWCFIGLAIGIIVWMAVVDYEQRKAAKAARKSPISGYMFGRTLSESLGLDPSKVKSVTVTADASSLAEITVVMYADWNATDGIKEQIKEFVLQERKQ
jgi:hypothetical protein